jgi:transposase
MARPFAVSITLSEAERAALVGWARRQKTAQALVLRARIVLAAAKPGTTNTAIAERLGVTMMTVTKWRTRFAERGLDGLHDEPRPGAQRTISDAHVEQVITTTLEETPTDATH